MGRASRKRALKRAGTWVEPQAQPARPAPRPREPFSWAKAKNFAIYGVAVLLAATVALTALPPRWQLAGAGGVYAVVTLGVIVWRGSRRGWQTLRRPLRTVLLTVAGVAAGAVGLNFMKGPLAQNPFFGILLGILLAGTGRALFPFEGEAT